MLGYSSDEDWRDGKDIDPPVARPDARGHPQPQSSGEIMQQAPDASDLQGWHKQFAAAANNRAWDLAVLTRTPAQDQEMLDAAHASAWHWRAVGTVQHRMRATMLLAEVHALLGHGKSAMRHAQEMQTYFLSDKQTPDWELAFTHAIYAHAAYAAGEHELHRQAYADAAAAMKAIADDEDRSLVAQTFDQVPQP